MDGDGTWYSARQGPSSVQPPGKSVQAFGNVVMGSAFKNEKS